MEVSSCSPCAAVELDGTIRPQRCDSETATLFSTLYAQLHSLARRELARRIAPANLSVTTLLHEAYINMSQRVGVDFPDQARFVAYAARVMRGVIIDHARSRTAIKRGGEVEISPLESNCGHAPDHFGAISQVSEALDELSEVEPELSEVVELKFFCGCSFAEIAALRNLSERTVQRRWEKARIFLRSKMRSQSADAR
jgi:RNA polymerase sigma factor (TIGR02999 family)